MVAFLIGDGGGVMGYFCFFFCSWLYFLWGFFLAFFVCWFGFFNVGFKQHKFGKPKLCITEKNQ